MNHALLFVSLMAASCQLAPKADTLPVLPIQPEGIPAVLASHQGEKAVLLNIWATWCVPCVEEMPYLVRLQGEFNDDLAVVLISADFPEDRPRVDAFLRDMGVTWQTYMKDGKDEPFILAVHPDWTGAMPATVVFDRYGRQVAFFEQPADYETFKTHILNAIQS
jgi:thiol-disulfide isomerase/thioredoxin